MARFQGWNIFQRRSLAGLQLGPKEWKEAVRDCGKRWKQMPVSEREAFKAIAAEEQGLREEAARQPLPSKDAKLNPERLSYQGVDTASKLSRNALKTVSRERLLATYSQYKQSTDWKEVCAGLATADGALSLDLVDLQTPDSNIFETWQPFASGFEAWQLSGRSAEAAVHHSVCHCLHGQCHARPFVGLAANFVRHMSRLLQEGALSTICLDYLASFFCLVIDIPKTLSQGSG